jgi:hypothetical protein
VVFRCDAGGPFGFGHVTRCLSLAEAVDDWATVAFAVAGGPAGARLAADRGRETQAVPAGLPREEEAGWLARRLGPRPGRRCRT